MANRQAGNITRLVTDMDSGRRKGFGFIKADGGDEFFFHVSGLRSGTKRFDDCMEGDKVEFVATEGPKGPRAEDVTVDD